MVLRGWRQVRRLHRGWERSEPGSEPQSATAVSTLWGVQAMLARTSRAAPEGGFWRLSGEEGILHPALPVAISLTDLQHLCFSRPQPLPLDNAAILPGTWCPLDLGIWGEYMQMMQILVHFEPLRDRTKFLKYFLPKVLFFCKTFVGKLTSFFSYYHYVIVVV